MGVLNKEKASFAIQSFLLFLGVSKDVRNLDHALLDEIKVKSLELLTQLQAGQQDPISSALKLNKLIEEVNLLLGAPYPSLMSDTNENLVKTEIVAFEHYLKQELKANHLSVQQEAPLFNDSLRLWEKVGVSLSAKEGVCEFSALIEKLNQMLPEEEHYPLPDENQF